MTTEQTLPQLANTVVIMGTIKEKNLEKIDSTYTDKQTQQQVTKKLIRGNIVVEVNEKKRNRIHNHKIEVYRYEGDNAVYKGLDTVLAEHQVGDFVKVTAGVDDNAFVDKQDELQERNKLGGVFFNRVTEVAEQIPCAEAKIKMVVQDYLPVNDTEGNIKHHKVKGFTVGYNGKIIPLHNVIIEPELGSQVAQFYPKGMNSVGEFSFDVNNYMDVATAPVETTQVGFGRQATNVVVGRSFVNNLEIIGGLPAERQFTQEEMTKVQQLRNLALEDVKRKHEDKKKNNASQGGQAPLQTQTPPVTGMAFGTVGAVTNAGSPFAPQELSISDDNLPF